MCALLVEVPEFSGPLDLLLSLIQKRRLDVTAVSLALVADQYLEQVWALEGELDALSEFLLLASQLLFIKSRALLPAEAGAEPEGDPAEELRRRLAEYQVLRAAACWLGERESEGLRSWPRGGELPSADGPTPLAPIAPAALAALFARRLAARSKDEPVAALAVSSRPTLLERARLLYAAVDADHWVALGRLLGGDVPTAVATFLAVLALVRRGLLVVRQDGCFAPLQIRREREAPTFLGEPSLAD
ncbi:MAG TPA: segregation/condensation protein A [Chloroflexota bacterium]|nr:segregation/condensation protein A [Chloroflexota bacterium]